jgi:GT2 family glycosyltransferase
VIAILVLTHERVHLLRLCVERVLARTSELTSEIVIWNNGSADGTREYLEGLSDLRLRIVHHPRNIGQNAYAQAARLTTAPYLIELDDDMIDAPPAWDRTLLQAYQRLPRIGFLAANLVDNPHDTAARVMYHERPHAYREEEQEGVRLLRGPVGGGCAITSRELLERAGGFRTHRRATFFLEDAAYIADIAPLGYEAAYLRDLRLTHAGGSHYARPSAAKHAYWTRHWRRAQRRNRVKRALLRVPLVRLLNARHGWFRLADVPDLETPS